MSKRIIAFFFSIILAISMVSLSEGFFTNPNRINPNSPGDTRQRDYTHENAAKPAEQGGYYGGHDTLTAEGTLLKEEVHKQTDPDGGARFIEEFSSRALPWLRSGAHDEDSTKTFGLYMESEAPIGPNGGGNFYQHYYDPDTGKGWLSNDSAVRRAMDYNLEIRKKIGCSPGGAGNLSTVDRQKIYDWFGRSLHLLQDMAHPSHSNNSPHLDPIFENYVNEHWDEIVNSKEFQEKVSVDQYKQGNYSAYPASVIGGFMHDLAKISKKYTTDNILTDLENMGEKDLYNAWLMQNVKDLIPEAVKYTAGYIDAIYEFMNNPQQYNPDCDRPPDLVSPAGDHPDDRFDVSDEFYWEKEFKLTEVDLIGLYMRSAIKKGKVGVWYKEQLIETFLNGRAKYKDAPQAEKDAILAKFDAIKKKLDQRRNEIESDWKGAPDIALFPNGFYNPSISLMLKIGEPVSFQDIDFNPAIIKDHPIMLVPTGGFYGLSKLDSAKALLDEYVKSGGVLVAFTQQFGSDWGLLPAAEDPQTGLKKPVAGYGYQEDQSCQFNSVYIDTYHPMLSGFSTSTANIGVDGYFTSYPDNSTVLLRRTANGQPAMILYPYGRGYVLATTLYTDFALSHSQANLAEINLVQNIISWAKKPDALLEFQPGGAVSVSVSVANYMDSTATAVKFTILDPFRAVLNESTKAISIAPSQTVSIPFSYTFAPNAILGIYHIDYTLLDGQGNIIQPQAETDSGRFVVSRQPQKYTSDKPIWFSVSTSSQEVLFGESFDYTFHIFNNSNETKNLTIRAQLRHTARNREWKVVANPNSEATVSGSDLFLDSWWFFETMAATLYDESMKQIGNYELSFKGTFPSATGTVNTDKTIYGRGGTVGINTALKNNTRISWQPDVEIIITDTRNNKMFEETKSLALSPYGSGAIGTSFTLPTSLSPGTYTVSSYWLYSGSIIFSSFTHFDVLDSQISVAPVAPSEFNSGTGVIPFTLTNSGRINVSSGVLEMSLKDPDGGIVFSRDQPFTLAAGVSQTLDIPLSIPSLKFGNYTFTYYQSDETRTGNPTSITLPNSANISISFDKPSYRIRETANLAIDLRNTGKFRQDNLSMTLVAADAGFTDTRAINLVPGQTLALQYAIPIPETMAAGRYEVRVTLTLPGGSSINRKTRLEVPEALLKVRYEGPANVAAGETLQVTIENSGGVDASYEAVLSLYDQSLGNKNLASQRDEGLLMVGAQKQISLSLPDQLKDADYTLMAELSNMQSAKSVTQFFPFKISGIKADLALETGQETYLTSEAITALAAIMNTGTALSKGKLHLEIGCSDLHGGLPVSIHIFPEKGGPEGEIGVLHFPSFFLQEELLLPMTADSAGSIKLTIVHAQWDAQNGFIDSLALRDGDGNLYPVSFFGLEGGTNYTQEVQAEDGLAADVTGKSYLARWDGLPTGATFTLVMAAREEGGGCGVIWVKEREVSLGSGAKVDLNIPAGIFREAGKFFLRGSLRNQLGQVISDSQFPFYVIQGDIALVLQPDKKVYKPSEEIIMTGQVENRGPVAAVGLNLHIQAAGEDLYNSELNLLAGAKYPFTIKTLASGERVVSVTGEVSQNNILLASVNDRYQVTTPRLYAFLSAPEVVGKDPFLLGVRLVNYGFVEMKIGYKITDQQGQVVDEREDTLSNSEFRVRQYPQRITASTTYTLEIKGDVTQQAVRTVRYGEGAQIQVDGSVFPEGQVILPFTVTNTGELDENLEVEVVLTRQDVAVSRETRRVPLPKGEKVTDKIYFDLPEGDYQLTATSILPVASAQAGLFVRKMNKVEMTVSPGTQAEGLIPVAINLTDAGYNALSGTVQCSVLNAQDEVIWSQQMAVQLPAQNSQGYSCNVNPAAIAPGSYTLSTSFLNDSGQPLAIQSSTMSIQGPKFEITQSPADQVFPPGQEATFSFKVKNRGNQEGALEFHFKSYDLVDLTRREMLKPGEERALDFAFLLPEDLEEKDYFATYEIVGSGIQGQVKYHLAGINLKVSPSLDKQVYREGETARLTLSLSSSQPAPLNLFARVNYPGYESKESFTLNGNQTLSWDVPITTISGEKLFFGLYHESGRSIHLNSLFIYKAGEAITLTPNKQVYKPGETVAVTVGSSQPVSGTLTLSAPNYEEVSSFSGSAQKSFVLPAVMTAGTYYISYQLSAVSGQQYTGSLPFDVDGIQVKVKKATLDKAKYASSDTMNLYLIVESNQDLPATLKTWIVDPEKNYSSAGTLGVALTGAQPLLAAQSSAFSTTKLGIHRMVYGIYKDEMLLCSGSYAFDVGEAVLLGISTDRADYPQADEPIAVEVKLYGTVPGNLEFSLDGQSVGNVPVSPSGFSTTQYTPPAISPGSHALKVSLTSGGLTSSKQMTFVYGSNLPDLSVRMTTDPNIRNGFMAITITVTNLGKTASAPTTLGLYDGEQLLATLDVKGLQPGESQNFTYSMNVLGRAGGNSLVSRIDPSNQVFEFSKANNEANLSFTVPDLSLAISLDKNVYGPGETAVITSSIYNLSKDQVPDLTLATEVKDAQGVQIFSKSQVLPTLEGKGSAAIQTPWPTDANIKEGVFNVSQTIQGKMTARATVSLEIKDFAKGLQGTITAQPNPVNQGGEETFDYTVTNKGNIDLSGLTVKVQVINPDTREVKNTFEKVVNLAPNGTISGNFSVSTAALAPRVYNAVLQAFSAVILTPKGLGSTDFEVKAAVPMISWAKTYGGDRTGVAYSIQQTLDGGYIAAGSTGSFSQNKRDAWVWKLDKKGDIQWQKAYGSGHGDAAYAVQPTTDGGYIVGGETKGDGEEEGKCWVWKLDLNGEIQWQKTYGKGWARSIQQTSEGGYIVAGVGEEGAWVMKLNGNGEIQWQKAYGRHEEAANSVGQTSEGGYVIAGVTGPEKSHAAGVWKLDAQGEIQWQKTYGDRQGEVAYSIQQTTEGGYIIAGVTSSFEEGNTDAWVLKIEAHGEIQWQKAYGGQQGDAAYSIHQTPDNGYIVVGVTNSFGNGDYDGWVLKLDAGGEVEWQKAYGGQHEDAAFAIEQAKDGGYIVAGGTNSFGDHDYDVWLWKLDEKGEIPACQEGWRKSTNVRAREATADAIEEHMKARDTHVLPKESHARVRQMQGWANDVCVGIPHISLDPSFRFLTFLGVKVGRSSTTTITIFNRGTGDLKIESIKVSGAPFSQKNDCAVLPPGHSCAIAVTFKPTARGPMDGVLEIYSNDPDERIVRLNLLGTGK